MTVARPGDEETDQAEPLLGNEESYSLSSLNEADERDETSSVPGRVASKYKQHKIKVIYPDVQTFPLRLIEKFAPSKTRKLAIFTFAVGLWAIFIVFLVFRTTSIPPVPGYGIPKRLTCFSNLYSNIVEQSVIPTSDISILPPFAFQCPPDCASARLQEEHYMGDQLIERKIWVIGGFGDGSQDPGSAYRADSYICGAAIHADVITDRDGGCGILTMNAGQGSFLGGRANGVESMDFNSSFPSSFTVSKLEQPSPRCYDLRWIPLVISVLLTTGISLLTDAPSIFFFSVFTIIFFQTALISDAPNFDNCLRTVQVALSRFLPAAFVAFAIYRFCVRKSLTNTNAQIEKTVLWLGSCWFGALENYTLDKMPLSRLTPRDLAEPGAVIVLISVLLVIVAAAAGQAWAFWLDGRFWKYLTLYLTLAAALLVLAFVPGLNLRIHHYILALLLLPGTAIQTRPSLLYQGLLVGLFINGVARWGFASILETDRFLAREGQLGSALPEFLVPVINSQNITFTFPSLSLDWDGISIMVNDAERTRIGRTAQDTVFSWDRFKNENLYFRFAYFKMGYIGGIMRGDYTKPDTWAANGTWSSWNAA